LVVHEAVAWKSTPAVSISQLALVRLDAPMARHTWPDFPSNVVGGAWNLSAVVVDDNAGAGEIGEDHGCVGLVAAKP